MNKAILLSCMLSMAIGANAQNINTVAGSGTAGFNGDASAATATQLWAPTGVAVIGGTVYVADRRNNRIRRVNGPGPIMTIAGNDNSDNTGDGGPATDASLNDPAGIAVDGAGNIYFADKSNNRVRKITPAGVITAFAGNGEKGWSGDGGAATAATLKAPIGVAVDRAGNVYIADAGNNIVRKVTPQGVISTIAGTGVAGYTSDTLKAVAVELNAPTGVAVDTAGNVYIADTWNYRIRKVTLDGKISTVAGTGGAGNKGDGDRATAAELNLPTGVAVDKEGSIYIAEQGSNRVRRVMPSGYVYTLAGTTKAGFSGDGGPGTIADMNEPYGIALDAAGTSLYVAEQENNRVRKINIPPIPKVAKPAPATAKAPTQQQPFKSPPPMRSGTPTYQPSQSGPNGVGQTTYHRKG
jgi:trimeric autotransporter adhesin